MNKIQPTLLSSVEKKKGKGFLLSSQGFDRIATVFLWGFAALTIGILLFILGFILYHGFISDNVIETKTLPTTDESVAVPWMEEEILVITHKGIRIPSLEAGAFSDLLMGVPSNWGNLSEQDLKVNLIGLQGVEGPFADKTTYKADAAELIATVAELPGAVGFIPLSEAHLLKNADVNVVPVWDLCLAVNPAVLEVRNNTKIRYVDESLLEEILSGRAANWNDIGGRDLPITLILPPEGSSGAVFLSQIGAVADEVDIRRSAAQDEQIGLINSIPGAVGVLPFFQAEALKLPLLSYQSRQRGRNIHMSFILEPPKRAGRVGGVSSIIINTLYMVFLTIFLSTPIGLGAAIYLVEYARQGRIIKILRLGTETLAGIPSIIFGLFGFIVFVGLFKMGIGLLSGTLTITLMILPTIIRTSEEALKSVPKSFREGSLALGAGKWKTIYKVVIPAATPGIVTGVVLGVGRAIGETAALLFTMGFDYRRAESLFTSSRVLSVHLYQLVKEGISFDRAFATATILIIVILGINLLMNSRIFRKRF